MKISKNFYAEEFLSKEDYEHIISRDLDPRWYIDKGIVDFLEWLKIMTNGAKITINDWKWGGVYNLSGLRSFSCDIGAELSQHKFINAVDIKVEGWSVEGIFAIISDNFEYINKHFGITTTEDIKKTPTWNHVDTRWTNMDKLFIV